MIKVSELIAMLQKVDPNLIVVLQKDSEGNGFSPLHGIDENAMYEARSTWHGDVKLRTLTEFLSKLGFTAEDVGDGEPCVILFPVN